MNLFSFITNYGNEEAYHLHYKEGRDEIGVNQKQLELKYYEPVWAVVHKLKKAMGNKDARYRLRNMIEFDQSHFTIESSEKEIRICGAVRK